MSTKTSDLSLALQVALDNQKNWQDGCVAWIEPRGEQCAKKRSTGYLCAMHLKVANRRLDKRKAKETAYLERKKKYHEANREKWEQQLEKVNAEIDRRTGVLTTDRAAYGGVGVPAIEKHNLRQFSDSNVERVGELLARQRDLEAKLRGVHGA